MRERYIADRIYQEWEHFTSYVTDSHKDMLKHYKPCETGDRQCSVRS